MQSAAPPTRSAVRSTHEGACGCNRLGHNRDRRASLVKKIILICAFPPQDRQVAKEGLSLAALKSARDP